MANPQLPRRKAWRAPAILVLSMLLGMPGALPPSPAAAALDPAPAATIWHQVTVVRKDGTTARDVTLAWILDGYLLEATAADGSVTTVAPVHVKAVLAADGRDLTDEVGDACPAHDVDFRLLGRGARVPFTFAIMGDAGAGLATGSAKGGRGPVPVLLGGLRAALGDRVHARVGLRRQSLEQEPDEGVVAYRSASTDLLLMLGGRLKDPRENNNYAYLEGGLLVARFDERFGAGDGDPSTASGLAAQGGVVLPLSPTRGIDLGVTVMSRPSLLQGAGRTLMISFNVALTFRGGGAQRDGP